jgi:hypothetical protein
VQIFKLKAEVVEAMRNREEEAKKKSVKQLLLAPKMFVGPQEI